MTLTSQPSLVIGTALPAGNNNIGDVDIATIAAGDSNIGNVDIVTLPSLVAGTAAIGIVTDNFSSRNDTYTTTTSGTTVDMSAAPKKFFSIQVVSTGSAASIWDIRLEISNDGTNFTQLIQHTNIDGDGVMKVSATAASAYFRSRCAGLTLGLATNVKAYIVGSQ